jgi:antitoxin component of MazEF toxin-antitoxin module
MRNSTESAKVRRIGNSRGILLSRSLCKLMGVDIDDHFRIDIDDDSLVLKPIKKGDLDA